MGLVSWAIDSIVGAFDPIRGVRRRYARKLLKRNAYQAAKNTEAMRKIGESGGSADSDLSMSLEKMRARCRDAYRNYPSARAAVESLVGVIVATGIDIEPKTGDDNDDKKLKDAWRQWTLEADASGKLDFFEMQRQACRSLTTNGEAIWQIVRIDRPGRLIPFALHAIESDQLSMDPVKDVPKSHYFRNGVETDRYGRPLYYHIIDHPGDDIYGLNIKASSVSNGRRIKASEIIHIYEKLRPGQSRGEPWLAPTLRTMVQETELVEAELTSAQVGAAFAAVVLTKEQGGTFGIKEGEDDDLEDDDGNEFTQISAGAVGRLNPGEDIKTIANTRPSQQISPFRDMLRGDISAALRISRVDLDKDYSNANYSSMRADMLDKKRLLTPAQNWFGRDTTSKIWYLILPELSVAADVTLEKEGSRKRKLQERHTLVPDGWPYVDPEKDIKAAVMGIQYGLGTYEDSLGSRGKDWREVHAQWEKEQNTEPVKMINEQENQRQQRKNGASDA